MTNPCSSGSPAISRRARRQQQRHAPNAASTAAAAPRTPTVTLTAATPPSESFGGGDDGGDGGDGGGGGGGDGGDGGGRGGGLGHGWEPHVAKQLFRTTSEVSQNCTRAAHQRVPRWSTQAIGGSGGGDGGDGGGGGAMQSPVSATLHLREGYDVAQRPKVPSSSGTYACSQRIGSLSCVSHQVGGSQVAPHSWWRPCTHAHGGTAGGGGATGGGGGGSGHSTSPSMSIRHTPSEAPYTHAA